jgi:hypothetical protein
MHLPSMERMSFWELVKNSPEWVTVLANSLSPTQSWARTVRVVGP